MLLLTAIVSLALVLIIAQLALAQQYTTQPNMSSTQPTGAEQTTPAAAPTGQNPIQNQPATGSQNSPASSNNLMHLDPNNHLVVDCPAVSDRLTQLQATQGTNPQSAALVGAQELSGLCADGGYTPSNGGEANGSSPNTTNSTQPQSQPATSSGG